MNKIYKVIWSNLRNAYVVVSELAGSSRNHRGYHEYSKALAAAVFAACVFSGSTVSAAGGSAAGTNAIADGNGATASAADSVAIGTKASASEESAVAIGNTASASERSTVAIGYAASSKGQNSTAIGNGAVAEKGSSVAIGSDTHAVNDSTVAIGSGSYANGRYSVAMGLSALAGTTTNDSSNPLDGGGSVALGYAADAAAGRSIAMGTGAAAQYSTFSTALGDSSNAQTEGSVALGAGSVATRAAGNKEQTITETTDYNTGTTTVTKTLGDELTAYLKPDTVASGQESVWTSTTGAVSVGGVASYKVYENGKIVTRTSVLTRQITNVAAGSEDTDAVNVAQLKAARTTVTSSDGSVGITATKDTTDNHTNYDLAITTASLSAGSDGRVTDTNPMTTSTKAYVTGDNVADAINKSGFSLTTSSSGGTVSGTTKEVVNPGETVTIDAGKNIAVTQSGNTISIATANDLNVNSVTYNTTDGTKTYTTKVDGTGIQLTPSETDSTKKISLTTNGLSNGGKQVTNMGSGINSTTKAYDINTNGANIGDVKAIAASAANGSKTVVTSSDGSVTIKDDGSDATHHSYDLSVNYSKMSGNFNLSYTGDNNSSGSNALSSAVAFNGKENQIVTNAENGKVTFRLADDVKGLNSLEAKTVNATTINGSSFHVAGDGSHSAITLSQGNVTMGGNKVTNVAAGTVSADSTDAVNGSQLYRTNEAISHIGGNINKLGTRINRVGAGAAALAALHPLDFDPDAKWDFAAGYGNYKDASAAAVGAYYRPDEDLMFSIGGSFGGGENMVNAGVSVKLGQGSHVTNSRVAMAKEIIALRDTVKKQDERIRKLETLMGAGAEAKETKRSLLFPDVPQNHWAYAYVKKLADRGLLEGYPDGEFKGNRTMTRYEFAAIFSRALENGAAVDGDMQHMADEFDPEIRELSLNRFRVDRAGGSDNDRHKIERVRVNSRDEMVRDSLVHRDVYGGVIEK